MLVDWSILTPILIAIFSAVGVFAFNDFKTFELYVNYFYLVASAIFISSPNLNLKFNNIIFNNIFSNALQTANFSVLVFLRNFGLSCLLTSC